MIVATGRRIAVTIGRWAAGFGVAAGLALAVPARVGAQQELMQAATQPVGGPSARWISQPARRFGFAATSDDGATPKDWTIAGGAWRVVADDATAPTHGSVLEMTRGDAVAPFNVALATGSRYRNVDLTVRMRAIAGKEDQGGGLVWRALDAKNYYVVRLNPLEGDLALFKVVDGQRELLQSAPARATTQPSADAWRTLRVVTAGPQVWCYLDGDPLIEASDDSLAATGAVGLWTKADAQSRFDDFRAGVFAPPDTRPDQAKVLFVGFHDRAVDAMGEASADVDLPVRLLTINEGDTPGTTVTGMNDVDYANYDVVYVLHIPESEGHALVSRFADAKRKNPKLRIVMLDRRAAADQELIDANLLEVDPTVIDYWRGFGPENLKRLLQYTKVKYLGEPGDVRPPVMTMKAGFYHPDLPRPVATWAEFDTWQRAQPGFDARQPLVAMFIQQDYIVYDNHSVYDAVIRELASRGIRVASIFGSSADMQTLVRACHPSLLMLQHHQGPEDDGSATTKPFLEEIGVPYLFCSGMVGGLTVEDWQSDVRGVKRGRWYGEMARHELFGIIEPFLVGMRGATAYGFSLDAPVPERVHRFADRVEGWLNLQRTPEAAKKLAVIYFHQTLGKSDVGRPAQEMSRYFEPIASLVKLLGALKQAGYAVGDAPTTNDALLKLMETSGRNVASWSPGDLDELVRDGKPVLISETQYLDWYDRKLSATDRAIVEAAHGPPPGKLMVIERGGQKFIVLPAITLGNVVLAPQPDRGGMQDQALLHSRTAPPPHNYLAFYWWLQEGFKADAMIHFGTHGSEFYLPGKEIFLGPDDFPDVIVGSMPNFDVWTQTNVGEALIAKRRSYSVIVDHLTPPIVPTARDADGQKMLDLIDRLRASSASPMRESLLRDLEAAARASPLTAEAGVTLADAQAMTDAQLDLLAVHLHHLDQAIYQDGMHVLGEPPTGDRAINFVASIVARNSDLLIKLADGGGGDSRAAEGVAQQWLKAILVGHADPGEAAKRLKLSIDANAFAAEIAMARKAFDGLAGTPAEITNLLAGLDGRFVPTGPGGDPVARPDSLPTGRNLYGLSPMEIPARQAWDLAKKLTDNYLATFAAQHDGRAPTQLAFTLTGLETFRDMGVMEAQVLNFIGVRPTWNAGGTVVDLTLIPRAELGHPRVDVALSVNSIYLKNFPQCLRMLDEAVRLANASDEADNAVRAGTLANRSFLLSHGLSGPKVDDLAAARVYGGAPGDNTARLIFMLPRSGTWNDKHDLLGLWRDTRANVFTDANWGESVPGLHDEVYRRTDAIISNWSDNLLGPLTNHHWSEETGGLAMSVESIAGRKVPVTVFDLRRRDDPVATSLEETLGLELRTLAFNKDWVAGQMEHGYIGATQFMQITDNVFRWDAVRDNALPNAAWGELIDVYVHDKMKLGMRDFFERNNPHALADIAATMLEASRKGYWKADAAQLREIASLYATLVGKYGASGGPYSGGNQSLRRYVTTTLDQPGDAAVKQTFLAKMDLSETSSPAAPADAIAGQQLVPSEPTTPTPAATRPAAATQAATAATAATQQASSPERSSEWITYAIAGVVVALLAFVGFRLKIGTPREE